MMPVKPKTYFGKSIAEWAAELGCHETTIRKRLAVGWASYYAVRTPAHEAHTVTFRDKTQTLKEWADEVGISHQLLHARLHKLGWSVAEALMISPNSDKNHHHGQSRIHQDKYIRNLLTSHWSNDR